MKASAQRKRSGYEQETHKKKKENMYNDLTLMLCSFGANCNSMAIKLAVSGGGGAATPGQEQLQ